MQGSFDFHRLLAKPVDLGGLGKLKLKVDRNKRSVNRVHSLANFIGIVHNPAVMAINEQVNKSVLAEKPTTILQIR